MNYPNLPGDYGRRPPRRSNFFFLFILCFMALFLFMQYKKASARADVYRKQQAKSQREKVEADVPDITIPDFSNDEKAADQQDVPRGSNGLPIGADTSKNGDWEIETDVPTEKDVPTQLVIGSDKGTEKTASGDWELEVGDSQASEGKEAIDADKKPEAKTSKKGDWELGEVETPGATAP